MRARALEPSAGAAARAERAHADVTRAAQRRSSSDAPLGSPGRFARPRVPTDDGFIRLE